jgi:hypothetical protein
MSSSHRSGRNISASIPYRSGRLCIEYTLNATALPLGMRTGAVRSGPPPVGSTVVRMVVRVLTGTEGYSRRADLLAERRKIGLGCYILSLITFCRYGSLLKSSRVRLIFASHVDVISARSFSITFGWRTSRKLIGQENTD